MRFEVLGPVRLRRDAGVSVPVSALRRRLLSVLLVRANRTVTTDVLAEVLWGETQPARPDKSLQVHVHRLRRVLDRPDRLVGVPSGYQLEVGPDELDVAVFGRLQGEARHARGAGDSDVAAAALREALALWNGAPYADVDDGLVVGPEARRLAEARLIAAEELYEVELARGRAREVVPELTELVAEFPLRERFTAQLMLALHRSGRQARALTAYRAARRRLMTQLGVEPGLELRELHDAMRAEDPRLLVDGAPPHQASGSDLPLRANTVVPGQLPPAPGAFVGRETEQADLDLAMATMDGPGVVVITGMAGVGKTGLALRVAHQVADRFGDGQLYLDLRGHASLPTVEPVEALGQLLRGLGADPSGSAVSVEAASAEYRSLLAGRKVLVVLDNAASAEQVRPLLPATPGCSTLVTSRNRLPGLIAREGARRIGLGVLPPDDARTMLSRLLGPERVAAEPTEITALVEACSCLPLALRIAAAQLADEPYRKVADYLAELRERGLAALALDDDVHSAVAAAFELSYLRLDPAAQRLFRVLGQVPGLDFTVDLAAAMSELPTGDVRAAFRRLTGAHLLDEHAAGRYRFHDLLRDYARQVADPSDAPTRAVVLERLYAWYYQGKQAARAVLIANRRELPPPILPAGLPEVTFAGTQQATAWLRTELHNIAAAVRLALSDAGDVVHWSWQLTVGLAVVMTNRGYVADVLPLTRAAVDAAQAAGDEVAVAHALTEHATVRYLAGLPVPDEMLAEALHRAERLGDRGVFGYCLNLAGVTCLRSGELDRAAEQLTRALTLYREAGDVGGQSLTLNNLGAVTYLQGDLERTAAAWEDILDLNDGKVTTATPIALTNLIWVRMMLGRLTDIDELIARAEVAVAQVGDRSKESQLALTRATWHRERGEYDIALELAGTAMRIADEVAQPHLQSGPRVQLGLCHLALDDVDAARVAFGQAKEFAEVVGARDSGSAAARGLALTALAIGDLQAAEAHARDAAELARGADRVGEAEALATLAAVEWEHGRLGESIGHAEHALAIHRETGHLLGQARAHRVLGMALVAGGEPEAKERGFDHFREARRRFEDFGAPEAEDVRGRLAAGTPG